MGVRPPWITFIFIPQAIFSRNLPSQRTFLEIISPQSPEQMVFIRERSYCLNDVLRCLLWNTEFSVAMVPNNVKYWVVTELNGVCHGRNAIRPCVYLSINGCIHLLNSIAVKNPLFAFVLVHVNIESLLRAPIRRQDCSNGRTAGMQNQRS